MLGAGGLGGDVWETNGSVEAGCGGRWWLMSLESGEARERCGYRWFWPRFLVYEVDGIKGYGRWVRKSRLSHREDMGVKVRS